DRGASRSRKHAKTDGRRGVRESRPRTVVGPRIDEVDRLLRRSLVRRGDALSGARDHVKNARPLGSVLIPAHNEAAVIERCLKTLFEGTEPGELEVAVVCNGCRDATADLARAFGQAVTVIELEEGSKPAALRAGDRCLRTFPRLYLDADVV